MKLSTQVFLCQRSQPYKGLSAHLLNEDPADVAVRNEGRLHSCKSRAPDTHVGQETGVSPSVFLFLPMQEWSRLCVMSVSEAQSLQRQPLLHRWDLNLASKPQLPFVTVGHKIPAGTGSKQHDYFCVFNSLVQLELLAVNIDMFLLLNRTDF